jgi:hypothetical protein
MTRIAINGFGRMGRLAPHGRRAHDVRGAGDELAIDGSTLSFSRHAAPGIVDAPSRMVTDGTQVKV